MKRASISPWLLAGGLALLLSLLTLVTRVTRENGEATAPAKAESAQEKVKDDLPCPSDTLPDAGICVPVPNRETLGPSSL